jgi:hypothetical protein
MNGRRVWRQPCGVTCGAGQWRLPLGASIEGLMRMLMRMLLGAGLIWLGGQPEDPTAS